jgi:hypothetical protein
MSSALTPRVQLIAKEFACQPNVALVKMVSHQTALPRISLKLVGVFNCRAINCINTCSSARSGDLRTRCVGSMPISPTRLEAEPSRAGSSPKSSRIPASFIPASVHRHQPVPSGRASCRPSQSARMP